MRNSHSDYTPTSSGSEPVAPEACSEGLRYQQSSRSPQTAQLNVSFVFSSSSLVSRVLPKEFRRSRQRIQIVNEGVLVPGSLEPANVPNRPAFSRVRALFR